MMETYVPTGVVVPVAYAFIKTHWTLQLKIALLSGEGGEIN